MLCLAANLPTETTTIIDNGYGQRLSADSGALPEITVQLFRGQFEPFTMAESKTYDVLIFYFV